MDLFVTNRFGAEENIKTSEEKNLSKLLSKIEKRKKQKQSGEKEKLLDEIEVKQEDKAKEVKTHSKSQKKSKHRVEESSVEEKDDQDNANRVSKDLENSTSHKRVKKKHQLNHHNDSTISQEALNEMEKNAQENNINVNIKLGKEEEGNGNDSNEKESRRKLKRKTKQLESGHCEKYTTLSEQTTAPKVRSKQKGEREELLSAFPKWLSEPTIIDSHFDTPSNTVEDIPLLAPWLLEKLKNSGVKYFFPVQLAVIPAVLQSSFLPPQHWPRDFCVSSPTGSGKTLAFVLPIVQALYDRVVPAIRALVMLPTQDLAAQVACVFRQYVIDTPLRVKLLSTEPFETEIRSLCYYSEHKKCYNSRVDIIVTTPGRLVEHLNSNPGFDLGHLQYLVVDEADLLIERSQHDWMQHLEKHLCTGRSEWKGVPPATISILETARRPPHRLYFSATLSHDPEVLSKMKLFQPQLFSVAHFKVYGVNKSFTTADGAVRYEHSKRLLSDLVVPRQLEQFYVECDVAAKPLQLYQLLMANNWDAVIVFANSVDAVHRLVTLLRVLGEGTLSVAEISSAVTTEERMSAARDFRRGKVRVIVSTDSFARGIDLPNVKCVISYDVPLIFQIYVHRVGRTCRAGLPGCAITLIDSKSAKHFYSSLSFFRKRKYLVKMDTPPRVEELDERYQAALQELETTISNEKQIEVQKRKNIKKQPRNQFRLKRLQNASQAKRPLNKKVVRRRGPSGSTL